MSKTNLAKGCPNPFVIWIAATIRSYATFTAISLLRSSLSQSVPEGWDGMCDLNKHCGSEFLYLVWRRMPTSVTTILPHRFVEDIVVCSFNLPADYLYFTGLLYRLNPFSPETVKPGYQRKTIFLQTSTRDSMATSRLK